MGIFDALTTAVSGLSAQSYALQNISGNIANSQTTAFKRINTQFTDLMGDNLPGKLLAGQVVAHEVGELGIDALERRGLRVGDVAGNVLQRIRLRAQTGDRGRKSVENTHDSFSTRDPSGRRAERAQAAISRPSSQALCQRK